MLHLLQLEWKKIAPNRLFKISVALYFILMPLLFFTIKTIMNPEEGSPQAVLFRPFYVFPDLWETTAYWTSWLTYFLLTYLSVWMVTTEYDNRTLRQNIITGIERRSLFLSKLLMILALALGATVYLLLATSIIGWWQGGYGYQWGEESFALGRFFVQAVFYMSFAFMLAILFRKSGLTMIVFFAYLAIIERVIRYLVFGQLIGELKWGSYFPGSAAWDVVPLYLVRRIPDFSEGMLDILLPLELATALTVMYTVLFFSIAYWVFSKRDL